MLLNAANYFIMFNVRCQTQSVVSCSDPCQVLVVEYAPGKLFALGYDPGTSVYPFHSIVFK